MTKNITHKEAGRIAFICFSLLSVLCVCFIFLNSLDSGIISYEKSTAVTDAINTSLDIVGIDESVPETDVRTFAHFSEFCLLTAFLSCALIFSPLKDILVDEVVPFRPILSLPLCFFVACTDELIQRFSDGRVMDFADVMIDTLGGFFAMSCFLLVCLTVHIIKLKKLQKRRYLAIKAIYRRKKV